jgi:hypothetical protein
MPVPGLSLVAFMPEPLAIEYLQKTCFLDDSSDEGAKAVWEQAKAQIGNSIPNVGCPAISPIPQEQGPYLASIPYQPFIEQALQGMVKAEFALIEIAPLIAWQAHVCMDQHQGNWASRMDPRIRKCLPTAPKDISFQWNKTLTHSGGSVTITSEDLNLLAPGIGEIMNDDGTLGHLPFQLCLETPWSSCCVQVADASYTMATIDASLLCEPPSVRCLAYFSTRQLPQPIPHRLTWVRLWVLMHLR